MVKKTHLISQIETGLFPIKLYELTNDDDNLKLLTNKSFYNHLAKKVFGDKFCRHVSL